MRLNWWRFSSLLTLLVWLCAIGTPAWSQSTATGTVSGQVTDPQNAVVAGAQVKVTDITTNNTLTAMTNDAGRYSFLNVPPGNYSITITKTGFSVYKVDGQRVEVGQLLTINAALQLGSTSTIVEVSSVAGAGLQTTNSTVGTTISGQSLLLLPNLGRDASTLAIFQPGVSPDGSVAGAIFDQNTFQLDGGNNTNDMDGSMNIYTPSFGSMSAYCPSCSGAPTGTVPTPVESIEQFKVATSGQTADFNSSSGSQVQMVTKRGTNALHGSGYEYYFATNVGAANSWDNNHTPAGGLPYTPLPVTHSNRFGASLGGPMLPKFLGGKTYFFFNYEGFRFPSSSVYQRTVPTALMRAGVIQILQGGIRVPYNLNPRAVTVDGVTYQPAVCPAGSCDPRMIGLNPIVSQLWQKYMPLPNNPQGNGDHFNTSGYLSTIATPQTSNNYVGRIDHDFGEKWRFMTSYRQFHWVRTTTNQVDIGGALGGAFGKPTATSLRPSVPSYWVAGLTTNITPTTTNDFRFSYLRNFWQWGTAGAPPQLPGLGGALEIGGESSNALIPYNVNTQQVRQRFWDGQDYMLRDDLSMLKGNHLISFGGLYERNFDYHLRNDNGGGIMNSPVYQIASGPGVTYPSQYVPASVPNSQISTWRTLYSEVLGIVSQPQDLYTRSGPNLTLQPPGSYMFDQSIIPFYNLYITDTWHMKPTFTLTYGLGYTIEMPPFELNGKQVELTDSSGKPIVLSDYLASRKSAALQGQVFNPTLGFATVANVTGASKKYPYQPFYGGLSPRVAAAWNPKFHDGILGKVFGDGKTVIRAGYGRIYGRLNGVALVLIPLLGTGLGQAVSCIGASRTGQCLGNSGVDPSTAFRIGTDGLTAPLPAVSQTLPQPYLPGIGGNAAAGSGTVIDPNFRPSRTENFNFSIQRELSPKMLLEVGYIGRLIRNEFQQINLDATPYMTTLGGQSFAQAYAQTFFAVCGSDPTCGNPASTAPVQPFFEAALGGPNSSFCKGFSSCTAAVVGNSTMNSQISQTQVYQLWATLNKASSWTLGRTMPSSPISGGGGQLSAIYSNSSIGFGNYNAGYVSFTGRDFHGVTARANFTYGRALGTGNQVQATSSYTVLDPWNIRSMYGPQIYDYKSVFNVMMMYQPPYFRSQKGIVGHLLGGWTIAPLFSARSGGPLMVNNLNGDCESFGEANCSTGSTLDGAVLASKYTGGNAVYYNQNVPTSATANPLGVGVNANPANGGQGVQMFANPVAVFNQFRPCVLGFDTSCGSNGNIRGLGTWNLDATVSKDIGVWRERVGGTLIFQFTNLLNHVQLGDPYLDISDPANFGVLGGANPLNGGQVNTPRQMVFGLRIHF